MHLWRGSLLPRVGPRSGATAPKPSNAACQVSSAGLIASASHSNGSKLPRHNESEQGTTHA
ncbi:hypothetical protein C1Y08_16050 [Pseudomonas sp. FW306-02-F02-AA]|nr:hypothetical protein C1Y07_05360 [Pseudomonas sp. FW306-02-F02-AB]PMZ09312.1 hypothetical protein C1Y06_15300 [Pseudomonas sp. FW306-02-H06C]PMZ15024.1 hypothetical protein C1Y08_16050 [Pseudomonas sp. FW306-02-F02-AA]PMZ20210.1 hypothetical protein C1Y09_20285 [Pseudomonas sp. FW306-02-F08-AA]PMZ29613.1 hypothetical protein C1Y05_03190 [Pseudomonas sp. FW306-02-F04-BA]PMZ35808.1 hypothetical protein C1X99_05390 [Pseudomonas sp. FW306-02-H06B]PMZ42723.1 hypothetical protein C1Y00_01110 [Ps